LISPFILTCICCARDHRGPGGGVAPPTLEVSWLHPSDGEALADTVRIELRTQGDAPDGIVIAADGVSVATIEEPPWSCSWLPEGGTRRIALTARAGAVAAGPIEVDWSPNEAPLVTIRIPRGARGVDRGSPDSLRTDVVDPEDGRLHGTAIVWTSDVQGRLGSGAAIPTRCLVDGPHRVRVTATDRWLRTGSAEIEIEAFTYGDGSTPEGTLEDVRHAWLAADPEVYGRLLAPSYRFSFCPFDRERDPTMPVGWNREDEVLFFCSLASAPRSIERVAWDVGSVQEALIDGRRMAKAEIQGIEIRAVSVDGESLGVVGGRACVYLARVALGEPWTIEQWRDRGGDTAHTQGQLRVAVRHS
jgi:hypothetical protein